VTPPEPSQWIFGTDDAIAAIALAVAGLSLLLSYFGWKVGRVQAQAALFRERFEVFSMVKQFLKPWFRDGAPDLTTLPILIDAWERSKFLFKPSVTQFLRQMWIDAVDASHNRDILSGAAEGDRQRASAALRDLTLKYLAGDADKPNGLVEAFASMKIDRDGMT
jgi:hypothetical protein